MKYKHYLIVSILVFIESWLIFSTTFESRENENWIGPYLSAAANLTPGGSFYIDQAEVIQFKELTPQEQYAYKFTKSSNELSYYNHNPIGFAYIIKLSTTLFPFLGDAYALILLQILTHILLCWLLIKTVNNKQFSLIFIVLYVLNPIILYPTILNFYYFWQCIPGFIILYLLLADKINYTLIIILTAFLILATLSRPTIIIITLATLILYFKYLPKKVSIPLIISAIGLFLVINKPIEKNIWHTVYVGIAAYPNKYVSEMSDNQGYNLYEQETGVALNASLGGNYYEDATINEYQAITKEKVFSILADNPSLFIKNAILNGFQCFSVGYFNVGITWLNILSAIFGIALLTLLIFTRQYLIILCIVLYVATFAIYYPPIQIYLFGAYVFSAFGGYNILAKYFNKQLEPIRFNRL